MCPTRHSRTWGKTAESACGASRSRLGCKKPSVTKGGSFREVSFRPVSLCLHRIPLKKVGKHSQSVAPGPWSDSKDSKDLLIIHRCLKTFTIYVLRILHASKIDCWMSAAHLHSPDPGFHSETWSALLWWREWASSTPPAAVKAE